MFDLCTAFDSDEDQSLADQKSARHKQKFRVLPGNERIRPQMSANTALHLEALCASSSMPSWVVADIQRRCCRMGIRGPIEITT